MSKSIFLVLLLTMLAGCNNNIDFDRLSYSTGTYKEGDTSYFVLNIHPKDSMTLELVELPVYQDVEVEVMEYTMIQAPEGWKTSKRLSFPVEINEDKSVTVVFISKDSAVDLMENKDAYLTINGEFFELTNE
ncbi:hypothetical protein [Ornithinibacillus bavariensis]|uniref:hypothetical protein n=1 Tax=Ornithinibacillus bavariensis TaxID=545502 RepID=UPI000ECCE2E4|nr:hypothetical protein [Ornithinibacillus sp.]